MEATARLPVDGETRETLAYLARIAEQAERYQDMVSFMTRLANVHADLGPEERKLLSAAYKNLVSSRRSAWRSASTAECKPRVAQDPVLQEQVNRFKLTIEREMADICQAIIGLVDGRLLTALREEDVEGRVFFLKMKGDYGRYLGEFMLEPDRGLVAAKS